MLLTIYVPRPGTAARSAHLRGSALVGRPVDGARVDTYHEDGRAGAVNVRTWEDRLLQAAYRLVDRAATTSRSVYPASELVPVGTYDTGTWAVVEITAPDALAQWLPVEERGAADGPHRIVAARMPLLAGWTGPPVAATAELTDGSEVVLFRCRGDELCVGTDELVGLTVHEARLLQRERRTRPRGS